MRSARRSGSRGDRRRRTRSCARRRPCRRFGHRLGGEPGVGKSTLVLQALASCRRSLEGRSLLIAAEESGDQVWRRGAAARSGRRGSRRARQRLTSTARDRRRQPVEPVVPCGRLHPGCVRSGVFVPGRVAEPGTRVRGTARRATRRPPGVATCSSDTSRRRRARRSAYPRTPRRHGPFLRR